MGGIGDAPDTLDGVTLSPSAGAQLTDSIENAINDESLLLDSRTMRDPRVSDGGNATLTPMKNKFSLDRPASRFLDDNDAGAPAPRAVTSRQEIHVPLRTSSNTPAANRKRLSLQRRLSADVTSYSMSSTPDSHHTRMFDPSRTPSSATRSPSTRTGSIGPSTMRSSADSVISLDSLAPSIASQCLGPLQNKGNAEEVDRLSPLLEDDPSSFDLVGALEENGRREFSLETRSEQLFSKEHLEAIFADTESFLRLTSFLSVARPKSLPILIYYLDALKALRAIKYANAVAEALEPIESLDFTSTPARCTVNAVLEEKARSAFDVLVRDDLPAFITHVFIQIASVSISKRVTGNLSPLLREASEGLAEVFCLTDPSRPDNPIIFASEEFHRTTQYGVSYAIGRNCRFLQGPKTNRDSVARFKTACVEGKDHSEVFLNYRRDGSPFMNLLMTAPLLDSRGKLRYYIGAQIDVSGLVKDGTDLQAFQQMLSQQEGLEDKEESKDEFRELCEMFNHSELKTMRRFGGNMHREHLTEKDDSIEHGGSRPRVLIQDQSTNDFAQAEKPGMHADGRLTGPYKHYLLIRPAPSLRILFTSPSLRVPGILQSSFLERIGGSDRVRESLSDAFADGRRGVTAKIRWLPHAVPNIESSPEEGRPRWIHCTPLLGPSGAVGVWMVVLVDEKEYSLRRIRVAPPIPNDIRNPSGTQPFARQEFKSELYNFDNDGNGEEEYGKHQHPPRLSSLPMNGVANRRARQFALDPFHVPPRSHSPGAPRSPLSPLNSRFPPMQDQRALPPPSLSAKNHFESRAPSVDSFAI